MIYIYIYAVFLPQYTAEHSSSNALPQPLILYSASEQWYFYCSYCTCSTTASEHVLSHIQQSSSMIPTVQDCYVVPEAHSLYRAMEVLQSALGLKETPDVHDLPQRHGDENDCL